MHPASCHHKHYLLVCLTSDPFRWNANYITAGMFTYDTRAREAILELLNLCRQRAGWPIKPLGDELQQMWGVKESTEPYGS